MKIFCLPMFLSLGSLLLLGSGALHGDAVNDFQKALDATTVVQEPVPEGVVDKQAVARFENFLSHLDEKTAREETEKVYAPNAFLNDTLKTIHSAPAIREYFIRTAQGLDSMKVTFDDMAVSGRNFYFRWTMETRMKHLSPGKTVRTIGITMVRFDPQGRVILHQDFWDSAQGLWDHVPVLGAVICWIRDRI